MVRLTFRFLILHVHVASLILRCRRILSLHDSRDQFRLGSSGEADRHRRGISRWLGSTRFLSQTDLVVNGLVNFLLTKLRDSRSEFVQFSSLLQAPSPLFVNLILVHLIKEKDFIVVECLDQILFGAAKEQSSSLLARPC